MQRLYVFVMCSVMGMLFGMSVLPAHAQLTPAIAFSELHWGGSARGIADEWFEFANLGAEDADVTGWSVTGLATGGGIITFPEGTVIPAGGTYLVANYAPGEASTLAVAGDLVTTAVSVPNTKITATLVAADGTVVDSVTDPGTPDFGSSVTPFASMERDLATLAWHAPTVSLNLVDATQLGTPGFANVPELALDTPPVMGETEGAATEDVLAPTIVPEDNIAEMPIVENVIANESIVPDALADGAADDAVGEEPTVDVPSEIIATELIDVPTEPEAAVDEPIMTEPAFVLDDVLEPTTATASIEEAIGDATEEPAAITIIEIVAEIENVTVVEDTIVDEETTVTTEETPAVTAPPTTNDPVVDPSTESNAGESGDLVTAKELVTAPSDSPIAGGEELEGTGAIVLNEIFVDGNEWIEVRNADDHDIDVSTWTVRDASGKATPLGTFVLAPDALLVIDAPKGKLNNDGDIVELVDGTGTVVDRVEYGTDALDAPNAEESLTRTADGWFVLTTITKGTTNAELRTADAALDEAAGDDVAVPSSDASEEEAYGLGAATPSSNPPPTYVAASNAPAPVVVADAVAPAPLGTPATAAVTKSGTTSSAAKTGTSVKASRTKTATTAKKTAKKPSSAKKKTVTTVTSIDGLADGALVRYTGTVLALPGTFGNQMLMLDGAAVYLYYADWPTLAVGDVVTVQGEISTARGERRIKLASADAIVFGEHVTPTPTDVATIDAAHNARLVRVTGVIGSREGDTLMLPVGNATVRVIASEKSGVHWSTLTGSNVTIVGVVRHLDGEYVLMPRSVDDVTVQHDEVIVSAAQRGGTFPTGEVVGGSMLASIAGVLAYWFVRSRTLIPSV